MSDAYLEDVRKKIGVIDNKLLAWIGSGINLLIINPRIGELFILTDSMLESADLEFNRHRILWVKLIIPLDQFLDAGKEILSLREGVYV